jgi:hypothetical protein
MLVGYNRKGDKSSRASRSSSVPSRDFRRGSVRGSEPLVRIRGPGGARTVSSFSSTRVGGAPCGYGGKILGEEQIERPIERDADFLSRRGNLLK